MQSRIGPLTLNSTANGADAAEAQLTSAQALIASVKGYVSEAVGTTVRRVLFSQWAEKVVLKPGEYAPLKTGVYTRRARHNPNKVRVIENRGVRAWANWLNTYGIPVAFEVWMHNRALKKDIRKRAQEASEKKSPPFSFLQKIADAGTSVQRWISGAFKHAQHPIQSLQSLKARLDTLPRKEWKYSSDKRSAQLVQPPSTLTRLKRWGLWLGLLAVAGWSAFAVGQAGAKSTDPVIEPMWAAEMADQSATPSTWGHPMAHHDDVCRTEHPTPGGVLSVTILKNQQNCAEKRYAADPAWIQGTGNTQATQTENAPQNNYLANTNWAVSDQGAIMSQVHDVVRGDTVYDIARSYGVTVQAILDHNPDLRVSYRSTRDDKKGMHVHIFPGQQIRIP